jgi:hypothetical protein
MSMGPKILLIDIETFPDVVWAWSPLWKTNAIAVKEHWYILSFAAQWYGEKKVTVKGLCDYKGYVSGPDKEERLLADIWGLLDKADIVVAHNGRAFDTKSIVARFISYGFTPPSSYKVVDTKSDLARVARFSSNKLEWLCDQLLDEKKLAHEGFDMWRGCANGVKKWWAKMKRYNKHDVEILNHLYGEIAPWIPQPNANVYHDDGVVRCTNPACQSTKVESKGIARLSSRTYRRYRCLLCGAEARATKSEGGTKVVPTART